MARKKSKKPSQPKSGKPAKSNAARQPIAWSMPMWVIALLLVASAVPGAFVGSSIGFSDHYREAVAEIGFFSLLVWVLWRNRHIRQGSLTFSWTRLWLTGLLLLGGISVFWSADIGFFASKYLLWLAAAAALGVAMTVRLDLDAMLQLARGFALIAAYISAVGLIQSMTSTDIFLQTVKPAANYHNRNTAMQVIVMALPMVIFMLLFEKRRELSILSFFVLVLGYGYAFHAPVRSAWLALILQILIIVAALIWLWHPLKTIIHKSLLGHRVFKVAAPVALLLLVAMASVSTDGQDSAFQNLINRFIALQNIIDNYWAASRVERYRIWDDALTMVRANPILGTGMGSFFHNLLTDSSKYESSAVLRVHNDILEIGVELGVVGILIFLAGAIGLAGTLFTVIRRGDLTTRVFFLLITAVLAGSALQMQVSFPYQMPGPIIMFGVYAGLILKAGGGRIRHITLRAHHWNAFMGAAGALLALVLTLNFAWLNTLFTTEGITRRAAWNKPIHLGPPLCHRSIARLFVGLASVYQKAGRHGESLSVARSLETCIPGSWMTEQFKIMDHYRNQRWAEALPLLLNIKQRGPIGNYRDYINLIAVHIKMGNLAEAHKVFEELIAQPEEYLIKRRGTLRTAMFFALQTNKIEEAKRFYRLLHLHYRLTPEFQKQVLARVPAEHSDAFLEWQNKLEAELSEEG